jgi:hypothetical protein
VLAAAAALGLLASLRLLSPSAAGDADQLEPLSPPPQGPSLLFCFFPLSLFAATVGGRIWDDAVMAMKQSTRSARRQAALRIILPVAQGGGMRYA